MLPAEIVQRIRQLYGSLRTTENSSEYIAKTINDILIFGEKIPPDLLSAAWTVFAKEAGVELN